MHDKLVHRHPHVFGLVEVDGANDVVANWEEIKKAEKGRERLRRHPVQPSRPALRLKVNKKAAGLPVDSALVAPDLGAAATGLGAAAGADEVTAEALGEVLLATVAVARDADIDPETALRGAAARLPRRGQGGRVVRVPQRGTVLVVGGERRGRGAGRRLERARRSSSSGSSVEGATVGVGAHGAGMVVVGVRGSPTWSSGRLHGGAAGNGGGGRRGGGRCAVRGTAWLFVFSHQAHNKISGLMGVGRAPRSRLSPST